MTKSLKHVVLDAEVGWPPMAPPRIRRVKAGGAGRVIDPRREWLRDRIAEAVRAMQRMPGERPQGYRSCMPASTQEEVEDLEVEAADLQAIAGLVRMGRTQSDVALADKLIEWLMPLEQFERVLVVARAVRCPWRKLAGLDPRRRSVGTLKQVYAAALDHILQRLEKNHEIPIADLTKI